jgi:hypothetical protein
VRQRDAVREAEIVESRHLGVGSICSWSNWSGIPMSNLIRNERLKLFARFASNVGVVLVLIAVVVPLFVRRDPAAMAYSAVLGLAGLLCVAAAVWLLGRLR